MSNETKREVLKKALDFFVMCGLRQSINYDFERYQYLSEYDTALPDDLPVIPKAVGEYIKDSDNLDLLVALTIASKGYKHSELWIAMHQNVFSSAWLDGVWRVEETGEIVKLEEEK